MKYTFTTLVALALGLSLCTSCNKENTEPINKKVEKKEEAKPLDIFIEDVKLYVGDSQLIKINNGDTSKFTFNFEDATIARAEVATEEISGVQIKRIKVTGLKAGATTFTVSDGKITTKPINVKVKSIDPITILGAKDGSLVAIKEYSLKLEENYNFTIRGGREEFELEYDKELLVVGDVKDNGEDFIVNVAVNPEVAVAQDAKLVVKQKENPENKAELTIHIVVPVNEYSLQFQKGGASYEPDRDSDGDPVIKLKVGEVLTIQQVGGSGEYYVEKAFGDALISIGATGLVSGKYQFGSSNYDGYLIPNGRVTITAKNGGSNQAKGHFNAKKIKQIGEQELVSKEGSYVSITIVD